MVSWTLGAVIYENWESELHIAYPGRNFNPNIDQYIGNRKVGVYFVIIVDNVLKVKTISTSTEGILQFKSDSFWKYLCYIPVKNIIMIYVLDIKRW